MSNIDNTPDGKKPISLHNNSSSTTIPQIILTEPPTSSPVNNHTNVHTDSEHDKLSPAYTNIIPLTRDALKRKNKLDRLHYQQQKKSQHDLSTTTAIDERITAGLGISIPKDSNSNNTTTKSRNRRSASTMAHKSDMDKQSLEPMYSDWSYDLDCKSITSGSTKNHRHSSSSVSGQSNRNSASMKAYSANHRYMDRHHQQDNIHTQYNRPLQVSGISKRSKYTFLSNLYDAVIRVVNIRASESEEISMIDHFDTSTTVYENTDIAPPVTHSHFTEKQQSPIISSSHNRLSWLSLVTTTEENRNSSHYDISKKYSGEITSTREQYIDHAVEEKFPYQFIPLQGNSLGLFGPNNRIRISVWKFIRLRQVETFIFFLMVSHWLLLACAPIRTHEQKSTFGGQWSHYPTLVIQSIYSLEAMAKVMAYGLMVPPKPTSSSFSDRIINFFYTSRQEEQEHRVKNFKRNHRAYLNSFGNAWDMVSILFYWIDFFLMLIKYPHLSLFKTLSAIRPLRLLSLLPGTFMILKSLETSWELLLAITGLIFFFLLIFALLGLISFQGVFSRRCYYTDENNILQLVEPASYCSGHMNSSTLIGPYNIETGINAYPGKLGNICTLGQICMEDPSNNPDYGFVNFDMIFSAFLSVFTFVSLELWTDLMYRTQDADSNVTALYYCLGVYIIAFSLTFLLFAAVTSAFAQVRAESSVSAFTAKKKGYPILLQDIHCADNEAMWTFNKRPEELMGAPIKIKLRIHIMKLVKRRSFFYFGGLMVLLDLVFMCLRSFNASDKTIELIDNAETAFTFFFSFEIILRMIGSNDWMHFWSSRRNLFDLFLVITTCVIQLPMIQDSWVYRYLTIFQILRVYRLFSCFPRVERLLIAALGTGENVIYVMVFLILTTALCSVVFMQMFGGDYENLVPENMAANRFDTFWEAFVALIVVYTGESWTAILYTGMESQKGHGSIYAAIAIGFYFAFGRYIMSALYIAVVLENFELSDDYIRLYQIKDFIQRHRYKDFDRTETILLKLFRPFYHFNEKTKSISISTLPSHLTAPISQSDLMTLLTDLPKKKKEDGQKRPTLFERKFTELASKIGNKVPFFHEESVKSVPIHPFFQDVDDTPEDYNTIAAEENRKAIKENSPVVKSLFLFSERSRIRNRCKKLVGSSDESQAEKKSLFNWLIMACVFVSTLMVILDEPSTRLLRKDTVTQTIYNKIEVGLSIVFVVEICMRILADGFLLTPHAYIRNHWNQLDLTVILLNLITLFMGSENAPRGLSTFRSFRILRLIRYFSGVRDIFVALFYSLPLMFDALIFTFMVLIPFAIYGVNIFGGLMWLCNDSSVESRNYCVGEYAYDISSDSNITVNILIPRVWQNPHVNFYSFDDFPSALQHLFSLTSTEGWVDSLFSAMSTPDEPDIQPIFNWSSGSVYHSIFYIVFMIISQGTIQLFVGVIIEKFKERRGITTLTTEQRQYSDLLRLLASVKPTIKMYRPTSKIRQICFDMAVEKHGRLKKFIMAIVCLNICLIASEFHNEPFWLSELQDYSYLVFTIIYVIECIIKLVGLGWKKWIRSKWNWFDCLIAAFALFLLILRFAVPDLWTLRAERYCLVLTAFRLGEGIEALQTLYHTIAKSLPSIIQVSAVFMATMCLFAMLFMEFFGLTKYGQYGDRHSNFRDYGNALLSLVRFTTGEAWNAILKDYTVQYPNCNRSDNYLEDDCGSPLWAYFLFNAFYIICTHIFLNLFTAVIISNFEYAYETRTRFTTITKSDLRIFKDAWAEIDIKGTGYIQKEDLTKFFRHLSGTFSFRIYDDIHSIANIKKASELGMHRYHINPSDNLIYRKNLLAAPINELFNINEMNKCINKLDVEEIRRRRIEYNIYYKEILRAETTRGIPFNSVLTILSFRFINISTSLTLDPLISRLQKIGQITQEYYLEKAAGFFVAEVKKRRFLKMLWKKRDEYEARKANKTALQGSNEYGSTDSFNNYLNNSRHRRKRTVAVPRIVISNTGISQSDSPTSSNSHSRSVSPMSAFSSDSPNDISYFGCADGLSPTRGPINQSITPSADNINIDLTIANISPSPHSPQSLLSPRIRQNWLLLDGNAEMTNEMSENLMESMNHNTWADMLREHEG
ncbi:Ion transport protein-domain-containing protein [Pilobolus umbonatus]|nr:Ion transport protein-domain-containing protein [Pilobolus umbonatus]